MTRDLLWRGMLSGILAALLATLFARVEAEPLVDRAIGFEEAHESHAMGHHDADADGDEQAEAEAPVSRATQRGIGLATAVLAYGAAIGGIFSLVFAYGYGRMGRIGPRALALLIAGLGFLAVVVVPGLKYPPNPPAVGHADTIQLRTGAYFAMIAMSLVALLVAGRLRAALNDRAGALNATLAAGAAYLVLVLLAQLTLPAIDEVPGDFPATMLWNFRIASIAMQLVLWTTLGVAFGWLAERCLRRAHAAR